MKLKRRYLKVLLVAMTTATLANAQEQTVTVEDQATQYFDVFRIACFDTRWTDGREAFDMKMMGFQEMSGESLRRRYNLGSLYLASFLSREDSDNERPVCTVVTRSAQAGAIRKKLSNWDFAGEPLADEIENGIRYTFWTVKYRQNAGDVLMEEEADSKGTTVRLSLVGE